jgi:subtilisin-like proprotein convertase family protein
MRLRTVGYSFPLTFIFLLSLTIVVFPQSGREAPETVFSNSASIAINTLATAPGVPTTAVPYPSTINVSGLSGTTTKVTVRLDGLSHWRLNQLDMLLVSPTGAKFILFSDVGSDNFPASDVAVTLDDAAPSGIFSGAPILSTSYKPTDVNTGVDTFPSPAPAGPYLNGTLAAAFNGADPNGAWSLYVVDDTLGVAGAIYRGWNITVTTTSSPAATFSNPAYIEIPDTTVKASPYGSPIDVSGQSGIISKLTVTLSGITHSNLADVDVLLVSPNGVSLRLLSDVSGTASNATLTFDDAATGGLPGSVNTASGTYRPTNFSDTTVDNDFFPAPAPPQLTFANQLSDFNNFSPNGQWMLFVSDDQAVNSGVISGGWSMDITVIPAPAPTFACVLPSLSLQGNTAVGNSPTNLASADFNNDGKPDLVATNQFSNDVSILLGDGLGNFPTQNLVTAGSAPYAVVAGKFNADNNFDIAVVNSGSNSISILLGNGDGTFAAPVNVGVGPSPISIAAGDFNNDNKQDLAVANYGGFFTGTVTILLGNGNGGFTASSNFRVGTQPSFVAVGNFNGDGFQDLAVANFGSNTVSIGTGNGTGSFRNTGNYTVGTGPVSIAISDFDNNGTQDLTVANYNSHSLSKLSGNGAGQFTLSFNTGVNGNPISIIAAANVLGPGTNQTIYANTVTNQVIFDQSGGAFTVGDNPNDIISADFNGDGLGDLATANSGSNDVSVLINHCSVPRGNLYDFDGNRRTDIAVFRPDPTAWYIQPFGAVAYNFGNPNDKIVSADYNGDKRNDLAVWRPENGLWIIDRTYFIQFGQSTDIPAPADFDGDGKADIAVFRPSNGTWYIRRSSDNSLQAVQFGTGGDKPVTADYDGDGKSDVAVFRPSNGTWYISRSSDGGFTAFNFGLSTDKIVPNDYDGDGKVDIAVFRDGTWYIQGSSTGFRVVNWGSAGDIPVPGDYDSDGKFDVAVFRASSQTWFIIHSSDNSVESAFYGATTDVPIPSEFVR